MIPCIFFSFLFNSRILTQILWICGLTSGLIGSIFEYVNRIAYFKNFFRKKTKNKKIRSKIERFKDDELHHLEDYTSWYYQGSLMWVFNRKYQKDYDNLEKLIHSLKGNEKT